MFFMTSFEHLTSIFVMLEQYFMALHNLVYVVKKNYPKFNISKNFSNRFKWLISLYLFAIC